MSLWLLRVHLVSWVPANIHTLGEINVELREWVSGSVVLGRWLVHNVLLLRRLADWMELRLLRVLMLRRRLNSA